MEGMIVVFAVFLLVVVTLFKGVRLVPQGSKWVVQRLGKYQKSLTSKKRASSGSLFIFSISKGILKWTFQNLA